VCRIKTRKPTEKLFGLPDENQIMRQEQESDRNVQFFLRLKKHCEMHLSKFYHIPIKIRLYSDKSRDLQKLSRKKKNKPVRGGKWVTCKKDEKKIRPQFFLNDTKC
jgi:hypothetical protein